MNNEMEMSILPIIIKSDNCTDNNKIKKSVILHYKLGK